MSELTWIVDPTTGNLLVEGLTEVQARNLVGDLLPPARELYCAVPPALLDLPPATPEEVATSICGRIAGYYHDSLIEGPGRRSVAKFQGCVLRCVGCAAQSSWDSAGGYLVPVGRLADALLESSYERDGISLLGGEPFLQPVALRALVRALRERGCGHILVYSGYTYERLRRMARTTSAIDDILAGVDMLIDGPFVAALADQAGPWTGSGNQRVIDLTATRRSDRVVTVPSIQECGDAL